MSITDVIPFLSKNGLACLFSPFDDSELSYTCLFILEGSYQI